MIQEIINILQEINPYTEINESSNLLGEDILDSTGLLVLIAEIEEKYNVEIPLDELQIEDFETVSGIVRFVERLLRGDR